MTSPASSASPPGPRPRSRLVDEVVRRLAPPPGVEVVAAVDEEEYFPPPPELRDLFRAVWSAASVALGRRPSGHRLPPRTTRCPPPSCSPDVPPGRVGA